MSNLSTYTDPAQLALAALPPALRAAVQATQDTRPAVGTMAEKSVQVGLVEALSAALFMLNHSTSFSDGPGETPGTAIRLLAGQVAAMVQRRFASFKPAEVVEAIRRGAAGDYHDPAKGVLYLSVPTVQSWLSRYRDEARTPARLLLSEAALADQEPKMSAFPFWHWWSAREGLQNALGLVQANLSPTGYPLIADVASLLQARKLYVWLDQLGILGRFCPPEERQHLFAAECQRLADLPVTTLGDGIARKAEIKQFASLLAEQSARLVTHNVANEARANCRRELLKRWVKSWPSVRDCDAYLIATWAHAYFTHYQNPAADALANDNPAAI